MRLFLTGSTGFIGSALLHYFRRNKLDLSVLIRNESVGLPSDISKVYGDLSSCLVNACEPPVFKGSVMKGYRGGQSHPSPHKDAVFDSLLGADVVVHAAARAHVTQDYSANPLEEYRKVNCDATLLLARMAAEAEVKRFVFVSSVKVNGEMTRPGHGFSPDDSFIPTDPYGLSKYEAEQGLLQIAKETGMEVVIIRPPLVYGPGVKANFALMMNWMGKRIPLPFGSIHNQRSLVALDNLVDFIALCADREKSPKAANQVFLISDNEDVSTTELLRKVAKAQNKHTPSGIKAWLIPIPVGLMTFAAKLIGKGDVANRLFGSLQVDSSKARDLLGWKPVVTMDEQLEKMAKVLVNEKSV